MVIIMNKEFISYQNSFIDYLSNNKRYSLNTVNSYKRDLDNYYGYIEAKKINYKKISKDFLSRPLFS